MDTPTLRILETLSSNIGDSLSINQLTERIKDAYGTAYYANIYQKLQDLKNEGLLTLNQIGRSSNVKLNFQNYLLIDALAEMETEKKRNFLTKRSDLIPLLTEMEQAFDDTCAIKTISATNLTKTLKLNRIELLILLRENQNHQQETINLYKETQKLQNKHNLKIDSLILNKTNFQELATTDEINPAREAISEKIILLSPQQFWRQIKEIAEKTEIKPIKAETKPANTAEVDLTYNLSRFGYTEFGRAITQGKKICLEYITTAILIQDDIRLQEAAPVILAKNSFKTNVLAFLSQKYGTARRLISMLKILQEIKPTQEINQTIDLLKTFNKEEIPADTESILQKLRLYNAL
jgi:hypothetical protein